MTQPAIPTPLWLPAEELYLRLLRETCDSLRAEYLRIYQVKQRQLYKLKLPAIIASSVGGFISFGSDNFQTTQRTINIVVGTIGLTCALLNTVETFFGLQTTMVSAKATSLALQTISQRIAVELALDHCDRSMSGISFLRDVYNEYETIMEQAVPIIHNRPDKDTMKKMAESVSSACLANSTATSPTGIEMKLRIYE
jgi:hypothetical protein